MSSILFILFLGLCDTDMCGGNIEYSIYSEVRAMPRLGQDRVKAPSSIEVVSQHILCLRLLGIARQVIIDLSLLQIIYFGFKLRLLDSD